MVEVYCDCDYCMYNIDGRCVSECIEIDGAAECRNYAENDTGRPDND